MIRSHNGVKVRGLVIFSKTGRQRSFYIAINLLCSCTGRLAIPERIKLLSLDF
jgi:hypothetical protein